VISLGHGTVGSNHLEAAEAFYDALLRRHPAPLRMGIYEVGKCGPDGLLVRVGWPSRVMQDTFLR
jgi:hypothetical protein